MFIFWNLIILKDYFYFSEDEASVMRANSWLYHYYMVQSRLQYGLAYGAHSPGLAAYYPHMLATPPQPQGYSPYDPAPHTPISPAYLSAAAGGHHTGFTGSSLYPGYHLYNPPPPHHYLPPAGADHAAHAHSAPSGHPRDTKDHGPLDFSKDYSGSRSQSDYHSSQQSSPSLRSDTSSSPVYHPPHESLYGAPEVAVLTQAGRHASISDHHYKAHLRPETQPRLRDHATGAGANTIGFWSDAQLSGFEKYKPESSEIVEHERKRVKKEADFYNSDSNNNSDGPPTYYSLDQLHLQHH